MTYKQLEAALVLKIEKKWREHFEEKLQQL